MTTIKRAIFIGACLLTGFACKEKFVPNVQSPVTGYLVVEGFINSSGGPSTITLTRTTRLYDTANIIYDNGATVTIESNNNETFPFAFSGNGTYVSAPITLNASEEYRVDIKTEDNNEYVSDYSPVQTTPAIDSISWKFQNGGVQIYVNTHDPANKAQYYRWDYSETWEYQSAYYSSLKFTYNPRTKNISGVAYRDSVNHQVDSSIYSCWHTTNSNVTTIASTTNLSSAVIYQPLVFIENGSQKLSYLYSIYVQQYAISENAYMFYQNLQKNTQNLGSIFDPQPSELPGNIHCITNPSKTVVGFVEVDQQQTMRTFISNSSIPEWVYDPGCEQILVPNNPDSLAFYGIGMIPTVPDQTLGGSIVNLYMSSSGCVDCTLTGSNIKPSFWP
jgi:Domain of unknown function (DUF4249)